MGSEGDKDPWEERFIRSFLAPALTGVLTLLLLLSTGLYLPQMH